MSRKNKKLGSAEDRHDLAVIARRKNESTITHREMLKKLKATYPDLLISKLSVF